MNKSMLLSALVATVAANSFGAYIDFKSTAFSGSNGQVSYSTNVNGVGVTVAASPSGSVIYWDNVDGLGVKNDNLSRTPTNGTEIDEIDGAERLSIAFNQSLYVQSISLTDLFRESTSSGSLYNEIGYYKVNGGSWVAFSANSSAVVGTNGEKVLTVNANVTNLLFMAAPNTTNGQNNEFSVAGITYQAATPVPEPSTLALFGLAMLSFVGYRRYRKN
jgi:hypothetical protein